MNKAKRQPPTASDIAPEINVAQLSAAKQQLDQEIEFLAQSAQSLQVARNKFQDSCEAVERQKDNPPGSELMVPLTGSMYIPGVVESNDSFIIELGTGYFVERNAKSAADYFKRKTKFLTEQAEHYLRMTQEKIQLRDSINETIQARVGSMAATTGPQAAQSLPAVTKS